MAADENAAKHIGAGRGYRDAGVHSLLSMLSEWPRMFVQESAVRTASRQAVTQTLGDILDGLSSVQQGQVLVCTGFLQQHMLDLSWHPVSGL
jgi:hypothetical protein